ncbi:MAG: DUF5985 family protein [Myxococcota bacterium]
MTLPALVYGTCLLTALACAGLLLRAYRRTGTGLLLWAGLCFAVLAVNEALVIVDLVLVPGRSFEVYRTAAGLLAVTLMLVGLVFQRRA